MVASGRAAAKVHTRPVASIAATLGVYRFGRSDPTTVLTPTELWRATLTPDGPATLRLRWPAGEVEAAAWGEGAEWMLGSVDGLVGGGDVGHRVSEGHPAVMRAQRNHGHLRLGASGTLYHDILPIIIAQRITSREAVAQWRRLVTALGQPAPGPAPALAHGAVPRLLTPPPPEALAARPPWWFHPLGIEAKRAQALRAVARHAVRLWQWSRLDARTCASKLALLSGVGPWTVGSVLGPVLGDPDALAVGDYHLKHTVCHALAGEGRGTDERMVELLQRYAGQRGRVVRWLLLDGHTAPRRGPRQRILPTHRW